ncbi:dolichyl pyrophosphate Glc1Man9GlcNAc2 alpha-1,3-glucosyltransferase-like [Ciona intestinalis]
MAAEISLEWCAIACTFIVTLLKLLLVPAYTSTDFEVHRNWLAITYSLPYKEWYFENTSEWTLDYPPFFAWFEWTLSQLAVFIDPKMVTISKESYKSIETVWFQRCSVIATDAIFIYACYRCATMLQKSDKRLPTHSSSPQKAAVFIIISVFNCGLIIVDHIHFQYNGMLFGFLFLSFANLMDENYLLSAMWFTILLNFKHIFLYIAPVYGVFFLRNYCTDKTANGFLAFLRIKSENLVTLASMVIVIFSMSFYPFFNQIQQVISRLFPFKRGLTHSYWAPNFWALYNAADISLQIVGKNLHILSPNSTSSATSGLVQEIEHAVLPHVSPLETFMLTFLAVNRNLLNIWFQPYFTKTASFNQFLRSIVLCSLTSFIFGWHVHEKAILMSILPATLLSLHGTRQRHKVFLLLQTVGHYSLFPLIFTPFETMIKICLLLLYCVYTYSAFSNVFSDIPKSYFRLPMLNHFETLYVYGLAVNEMYCLLIHPFLTSQFTFLPLMLTSTYCSIGILYCWFLLYQHAISLSYLPYLKKYN